MRTEFLAAYEKLNRINKKTLEKEGKEADNYSYVDYEDFVLIFFKNFEIFHWTGNKIEFYRFAKFICFINIWKRRTIK